ncbi:MAG: VanZ family protein [Oceanicaulis sp.]|nr:VanZ family protein [Oceanicaulis sp.]
MRALAVQARAWGPLAFWFTLAVVLGLALWPGDGGAPRLFGWDKLEHISAFVTLTVLGRFAFPGLARVWLALGLSGFGIAIELLQMIEALNRSASPYDVGANTVGIALGLAIAMAVAWAARRLGIHP